MLEAMWGTMTMIASRKRTTGKKNSTSPLHHHQLRRLGDELVQEEGEGANQAKESGNEVGVEDGSNEGGDDEGDDEGADNDGGSDEDEKTT